MDKPPTDRYAARARFIASIKRHGLSADATYDLTRDFDAAVGVEAEKLSATRPEWLVVEEARTEVRGEVRAELVEQYREQLASLGQASRDALAGMRVVGDARRAGRKTVRIVDVYAAVEAARPTN